MSSAAGRSNRNRGARAEVQVVNYLRTQGWPDARRYLAGDGRQPGDIDVWPGISVEVKDRKQSAWPSWQRQAVAEADWRIPIVVRRTRGQPDVGEWEARVEATRWIELAGAIGPGIPTDRYGWVIVPFKQIVELMQLEQERNAA